MHVVLFQKIIFKAFIVSLNFFSLGSYPVTISVIALIRNGTGERNSTITDLALSFNVTKNLSLDSS